MSAEPPFARMVSQAMSERGLALRALCREVEIDASFFSKVLAGKRSPPAEEDVLRRIALVLGLDPARLVVAAGRIPSEWKAVWTDEGVFGAVDALASGRSRSVPAPAAPRLAPQKATFGDELL